MLLRILVVGFISLVIGLIGGYQLKNSNNLKSSTPDSNCPNTYTYLNDQIDCNSKQVLNKSLYTEFSFQLQEYILDKKKGGG